MRLVLIGPVYPYKGGISHYTGMLCRSLSKEHEVRMISYSMQYPKFMYKKKQKDFGDDTLKISGTKFLIDTANPFSWSRTVKDIREYAPDMVIIQWWHPYFSPCYISMAGKLGKFTKVMFICHNVFPHERFPMDRFLTKRVLSKGDMFIVHSEEDRKDLMSIVPDAPVIRSPLPVFDMFGGKDLTKTQARTAVGEDPDCKMILFFGFVRKYKGLMHLINAMPAVHEALPDARLYIAGDFGDDRDEYIRRAEDSGILSYTTIREGYIPDKEAGKYFAACDLVVLPYESATQSGIVQTAFSFGKPVVVTNVGGLPEVVEDGRTGYIVPPQDPKAIAERIVKFFTEDDREAFTSNIRKEAYKYSWDRVNENVRKLYEGVNTDEQ
ncbi:MAG: glycosyltransferase [Clostridiales bacterium]|nr:glycosyltransferase [Clostridiales bacterium]